MVLPVVDHAFSQFSSFPPSDLRPTVEESMVLEQVRMLSYTDYSLAVGLVGLCSADTTSTKAADTADYAREAFQVGLCAIKHAAGITLKVHVNLELARRDKPI